jgi:transcription elongation GreA/GreB family factor
MKKTIVTKDGLERLKEKLNNKMEELRILRDEKAHAYSASGDGWHDNPGWIQLGQKEEQLVHELAKIQQSVCSAYIIDPDKIDKTKVGLGCTVEFIISKPGSLKRTQKMIVVGTGESDVKNKKIAFDSPMGKALVSMSVNEEKVVELPGGLIQIKIQMISYE